MSEKLTKEMVDEFARTILHCPVLEEDGVKDRFWKDIQADRDTIRAEVRKEVTEEILKTRYEIGEEVQYKLDEDTWRNGFIAIRLGATLEWASGCYGVRRPPKTRPMTQGEMGVAICEWCGWNSGEILKMDVDVQIAILKKAGIPTEVTE